VVRSSGIFMRSIPETIPIYTYAPIFKDKYIQIEWCARNKDHPKHLLVSFMGGGCSLNVKEKEIIDFNGNIYAKGRGGLFKAWLKMKNKDNTCKVQINPDKPKSIPLLEVTDGKVYEELEETITDLAAVVSMDDIRPTVDIHSHPHALTWSTDLFLHLCDVCGKVFKKGVGFTCLQTIVETVAVEKTVETKTVETKPVETKPVETKPVETKPVETKIVDCNFDLCWNCYVMEIQVLNEKADYMMMQTKGEIWLEKKVKKEGSIKAQNKTKQSSEGHGCSLSQKQKNHYYSFT